MAGETALTSRQPRLDCPATMQEAPSQGAGKAERASKRVSKRSCKRATRPAARLSSVRPIAVAIKPQSCRCVIRCASHPYRAPYHNTTIAPLPCRGPPKQQNLSATDSWASILAGGVSPASAVENPPASGHLDSAAAEELPRPAVNLRGPRVFQRKAYSKRTSEMASKSSSKGVSREGLRERFLGGFQGKGFQELQRTPEGFRGLLRASKGFHMVAGALGM